MTGWVRFVRDFDCHAGPVTTAYKAGWSGRVKRACADLAVSSGAAEWVEVPRRVQFQPTSEDIE